MQSGIDDLMIFAAEGLIHAFHEEMGKTWTGSKPEFVCRGHSTRFCGLQIQFDDEGSVWIHQSDYIQDVLTRHDDPPERTTEPPPWIK